MLALREITPGDSVAAARLSEELGYPATAQEMEERIESLEARAHQAVFVALLDEEVVGWVDVSVTHHLVSEPRAEIGGLVVASGMRGRAIGRHLMVRAEQWAVERGLKSMVVRSRDAREAAHRFYVREGYTRTKLSVVFTKDLV